MDEGCGDAAVPLLGAESPSSFRSAESSSSPSPAPSPSPRTGTAPPIHRSKIYSMPLLGLWCDECECPAHGLPRPMVEAVKQEAHLIKSLHTVVKTLKLGRIEWNRLWCSECNQPAHGLPMRLRGELEARCAEIIQRTDRAESVSSNAPVPEKKVVDNVVDGEVAEVLEATLAVEEDGDDVFRPSLNPERPVSGWRLSLPQPLLPGSGVNGVNALNGGNASNGGALNGVNGVNLSNPTANPKEKKHADPQVVNTFRMPLIVPLGVQGGGGSPMSPIGVGAASPMRMASPVSTPSGAAAKPFPPFAIPPTRGTKGTRPPTFATPLDMKAIQDQNELLPSPKRHQFETLTASPDSKGVASPSIFSPLQTPTPQRRKYELEAHRFMRADKSVESPLLGRPLNPPPARLWQPSEGPVPTRHNTYVQPSFSPSPLRKSSPENSPKKKRRPLNL